MAIKINISEDEKRLIIQAVKKSNGETTSVAKLANSVGINPNRARFIVDELIDEGRVIKTPTKQFNERYVRYKYEAVSK